MLLRPCVVCCRQTEGFSCSDLVQLCHQAARGAAQEVGRLPCWACSAVLDSDLAQCYAPKGRHGLGHVSGLPVRTSIPPALRLSDLLLLLLSLVLPARSAPSVPSAWLTWRLHSTACCQPRSSSTRRSTRCSSSTFRAMAPPACGGSTPDRTRVKAERSRLGDQTY